MRKRVVVRRVEQGNPAAVENNVELSRFIAQVLAFVLVDIVD